jgi:hypothetical protein
MNSIFLVYISIRANAIFETTLIANLAEARQTGVHPFYGLAKTSTNIFTISNT